MTDILIIIAIAYKFYHLSCTTSFDIAYFYVVSDPLSSFESMPIRTTDKDMQHKSVRGDDLPFSS